jgi:serine/threonine-protein kinase HipA
MGVFADSLPDGWGMLLMDRFFLRERGIDRRAMGALEYRPVLEKAETDSSLDLERLCQAALEVYEGDTETTLDAFRLAGGSPAGGAAQGRRGAVTEQAALCVVIQNVGRGLRALVG